MFRPESFTIYATDAERCIAFYSALFRWRFVKQDQPLNGWRILTGEADAAGINGTLVLRNSIWVGNSELRGFVNAFICTIEVPDVDAIRKRIADLGGVAFRKEHAAGIGWHVSAKDPEGNIFSLRQRELKN